jgi:hypothetical protein
MRRKAPTITARTNTAIKIGIILPSIIGYFWLFANTEFADKVIDKGEIRY